MEQHLFKSAAGKAGLFKALWRPLSKAKNSIPFVKRVPKGDLASYGIGLPAYTAVWDRFFNPDDPDLLSSNFYRQFSNALSAGSYVAAHRAAKAPGGGLGAALAWGTTLPLIKGVGAESYHFMRGSRENQGDKIDLSDISSAIRESVPEPAEAPSNVPAAIGLGLAALGLGGAGYLGYRMLKNDDEEVKTQSGGKIRIALPREDGQETLVELPMDDIDMSKTLYGKVRRDVRRRLYSGVNSRTRHRTDDEETDDDE